MSTRLGRRVRYGAAAAIVIGATTVSCVMANLIAQRLALRVDVTSLGEHRLSERTRSLLDSLDGEYEVVIAADWATKDRRVSTRVQDAVARFDAAGDAVTTTLIDTGSASGVAAYEALLDRLVQREAGEIEAQSRLLTGAADEIDRAAALYESLSAAMTEMAAALTAQDAIIQQSRVYFLNQAGQMRAGAAQERSRATAVREALAAPTSLGAPAIQQARSLVEHHLASLDGDLSLLSDNLSAFARSAQMPEEVARTAGSLQQQVRGQRDAVAVLLDRVSRLETLDVSRIAGALTAGEAAVVIGPDALVGVDMSMLLPPGEWLDQERGVEADMGRRAEELLAGAVGALAAPNRPIVVVVHGQATPFMDRLPVFQLVRRRLELQGVDFVEWAVVAEPEEPDLTTLDLSGQRPVVYVMIGTDTSPSQSEGPSGPERAEILGRTLKQLVDEGRPLLYSLVPSYLPGMGLDDPTLAALAPFGIHAETGMPLIRRESSAGGPSFESLFRVDAVASDHPLFEAVRGLPTALDWPIGIRLLDEPEDVTRRIVFEIDGDDAWGESQWVAVRQTAPDRRASMPNPPAPSPERDWVDGPYVLGVAAERRPPGAAAAQRLIVIGAYNWFFDPLTTEATLVDERIIAANPGNAELFEASVLWLAGEDDRIARSPTARAAPRIAPMAPARLTLIRWILVGGLPALILVIGGLWRLVAR